MKIVSTVEEVRAQVKRVEKRGIYDRIRTNYGISA